MPSYHTRRRAAGRRTDCLCRVGWTDGRRKCGPSIFYKHTSTHHGRHRHTIGIPLPQSDLFSPRPVKTPSHAARCQGQPESVAEAHLVPLFLRLQRRPNRRSVAPLTRPVVAVIVACSWRRPCQPTAPAVHSHFLLRAYCQLVDPHWRSLLYNPEQRHNSCRGIVSSLLLHPLLGFLRIWTTCVVLY